MKYEIHRLDGRYRYRSWFEYYIGFGSRMSLNRGPENFNHVHQWFINTYGWSAEVRQYEDIYSWSASSAPMMAVKGGWSKRIPKDLPRDCNAHWSWTNGYDDLRIYIKSDAELAFFQLAHPIS